MMEDNAKSTILSGKLKSISDRLTDLNDILKRSAESGRDVSYMMTYKAVEDGLLEKIYDANPIQLNYMMNCYRFIYYTEYNKDKELLRREVQKRLRDKKLEDLLK